MVKITILSPKNAKLVLDNPLVLAQFGDGSFTNSNNEGINFMYKKSLVENEKFIAGG